MNWQRTIETLNSRERRWDRQYRNITQELHQSKTAQLKQRMKTGIHQTEKHATQVARISSNKNRIFKQSYRSRRNC